MRNVIILAVLSFFTGLKGMSQTDTTRPTGNFMVIDGQLPVSENTLKNEKRKLIRGFSIQSENDFFASLLKLKNEDKDYTGSFKFEFYTDFLAKGIFPFFMNRQDPFDLKLNINSIYIQGMGFTPNRDAFAETAPVRDQRPYASLVGIGKKRIAYFDNNFITKKAMVLVSDLFIGRIGSKLPGEFQNFLHEYVTNSNKVKGWENQIANGGKWAANYSLQALFETFEFGYQDRKQVLIFSPHGSFGNIFINAGGKISVTDLRLDRIPFMQTMNSNQVAGDAKKQTYDPSVKFDNRNIGTILKTHFDYEVYGKITAVGRNSLLMGMPYYDNSVYKLQRSQLSNAVIDFGAKLYFYYHPDKPGNQLINRLNSVYFELLHRSREFSFGHDHIYGGLGFQLMKL